MQYLIEETAETIEAIEDADQDHLRVQNVVVLAVAGVQAKRLERLLADAAPQAVGADLRHKREHIVANSYSGVSGAGKKVDEMYLYVERAESIKAYGLVKHRHLAEIEEQIALRSGAPAIIQFNPHLAPMRRGIATTITVPAATGATIETLYAAWNETYAGRTFVQLLPSGETPDTAHVVGTNRVDMSAVLDPRTKNFVITSVVDNVVKGASGQAVQIMNLWLGFPETAGLV